MKHALFSFIAIIAGFILAIFFIKTKLLANDTKFDQAGLGEGTAAYFPQIGARPFHVDSFYKYAPMESLVKDSAFDKELVLWLGNSQLHGVNQYKQGDENAIAYLHNLLTGQNKFAFAYSIPNANLQEHYLLLAYISSRLPVKQLIMPVFFDDTRETGLREDVLHAPIVNAIKPLVDSSELGKSIAAAIKNVSSTKEDNGDMKALKATTQEKVELYLNKELSDVSTIWASRANMRSAIIYSYLFSFRNTMLGITPNSKRKKIPARYQLNMEAFESIIALCRQKGIRLLVYVPPIRDDVDQPYIQEEYNAFKNDLNTLQKKNGFTLYNAEGLVPAKYWGLKGSTTIGKGKLEIDFMHFQSPGHRLLANGIAAHIQ